MINNAYTANTKQNGQVLSADDWNAISSAVATAHTEINDILTNAQTPTESNSAVSVVEDTNATDPTVNIAVASGVPTIGTPNVIQLTKKKKGVNTTVVSGNNINIEPRKSIDDTKGGNISFKPGDDIEFCSHHRLADNQDEVSVKVIDGDDVPVKLQVNAASMTLTTKDKTGDDAAVFDVNVNSGKNTKGYLKVRAQAIDLRCEEHGGIALQPKGQDGSGHMDKIKFEHGGGDGLEFGTFNTEKTSIFTDEYRFNREGVWKMATREKLDNTKGLAGIAGVDRGNGKYDPSKDGIDETKHYSYKKQSDDFYDIIAQDDEQCTTKDIIKTAYAMNGGKSRHTKITNKGAIEIATNPTYTVVIEETPVDPSTATAISDISTKIAALDSVAAGDAFNENDFTAVPTASIVYTNGAQYFSFTEVAAPSIKIESGSELKLGGVLDFGSTFNFGETDNGIEVQNKYTAKGKTKDCGKLKVIAVNNNASAHTFNTLWDPAANDNTGASITETTVNVPAGESRQIAEASIYDIIKLVNYMKSNGQGPWDPSLNL